MGCEGNANDVLETRSYMSNPASAHAREEALMHAERMSGMEPEEEEVDDGGDGVDSTTRKMSTTDLGKRKRCNEDSNAVEMERVRSTAGGGWVATHGANSTWIWRDPLPVNSARPPPLAVDGRGPYTAARTDVPMGVSINELPEEEPPPWEVEFELEVDDRMEVAAKRVVRVGVVEVVVVVEDEVEVVIGR